MRRAGFDLASASDRAPRPQEIAAYVELHIEQGPWLEAEDVPIGVVERIVGIRRFRLTFVGQPDHAGTTPMDRRKDAFLTAAEYATKSRELVVRSGEGRAVTTIGVVEVRPGVPNIVPERATLLQELRDVRSCASRAAGEPHPPGRSASRARQRGLVLEVEHLMRADPVRMSPRIQATIETTARELGLRDPAHARPAPATTREVLAAVTDAGMIFVPSQGGRSHRPDEWTGLARRSSVARTCCLGTLLHLELA